MPGIDGRLIGPGEEDIVQRLLQNGRVATRQIGAADRACEETVPREGDALAQERDLLVQVDDRRGGSRPLVRPPARFSLSRNEIRARAPRRGEHNALVLSELLGYSDARIRELETAAVLSASSPDER